MQFRYSHTPSNLSHSSSLKNTGFAGNSANVWAFIDMQNLYQSVQEERWKINWRLFFQYLAKVHNVSRAVGFMGYVYENRWIYSRIMKAGFTIEFREVNRLADGKIEGGNCDADLTGYAMNYKYDYDKAILIGDDGDYCNTLKLLKKQNKLKLVISPHSIDKTSELIKKGIGLNFILSIQNIRTLIEHK